MIESRTEVLARQAVLAFLRIAPPAGDQFRQISVTFPILCEQYEAQIVMTSSRRRKYFLPLRSGEKAGVRCQPELGADDQFQPGVFCGRMRTDHAGQ